MNKIKFSNYYWKFPDSVEDGSQVNLIQALKIHYDDLEPQMIRYDATYTRNHHVREYKLPKTDLILLIFQRFPNVIFTTIRRYTPKKWQYYKENVGEYFEVDIA